MTNVYAKLNTARIELQGRELKKTGRNKFAGYNYFELGDFLPTVQEIFQAIGLCGVVTYGADEASLVITDCDNSESQIVIKSPMSSAALKGAHEIQNLGAVQTYLRRYLWVTAMEIVEHDALDATLGEDKDSKGAKAAGKAPRTADDGSRTRTPFRPGQSVAPAAEEPIQALLEIKANYLGLTPFGVTTLLTICKSESIKTIEDGKAQQIYNALTADLVQKFNAGRNSRNQVIVQPPIEGVKSEDIADLEAHASSLFSDDD